jgi:hypothetical protein
VRSALFLLNMDILWEILYASFECRSRASCRSIITMLSCSLSLFHRDALVLAVALSSRRSRACCHSFIATFSCSLLLFHRNALVLAVVLSSTFSCSLSLFHRDALVLAVALSSRRSCARCRSFIVTLSCLLSLLRSSHVLHMVWLAVILFS